MAINFPDSPSVNQVHTVGQRKWRWNGEKWRKVQADVPSALPSLTVDGDLTVHGTTTTLSAEELRIEDNIITLNDGQTGTPTLHAGVEVERGDADNSAIRWNETDDRWEYSADSTTYYPISYQPSGSISLYGGATAPTGWLLCDGSAVSRTTYAELFAVVGTAYGSGDGSTTFNVPSLSGKVPVGLDSSNTDYDALGETGGSNTHTLTTAEMPSHNHSVSVVSSSDNSGGVSTSYTGSSLTNGNAAATNSTGNQSANHTHNGTSGDQSANHVHNNTSNPSSNHYHGTNTTNLNYNHSHSGNTSGNLNTAIQRINSYNKYGCYNTLTGGGYIHGGWSVGVDWGWNHSHSFNTNGANLDWNHSHGNTGNVNAWHTHSTNSQSANHTHNTTTGDQSANHTHGMGHMHDMAHTHSIAHGHTASASNTGSDGAHSIVQPYIVLNYIIKV